MDQDLKGHGFSRANKPNTNGSGLLAPGDAQVQRRRPFALVKLAQNEQNCSHSNPALRVFSEKIPGIIRTCERIEI